MAPASDPISVGTLSELRRRWIGLFIRRPRRTPLVHPARWDARSCLTSDIGREAAVSRTFASRSVTDCVSSARPLLYQSFETSKPGVAISIRRVHLPTRTVARRCSIGPRRLARARWYPQLALAARSLVSTARVCFLRPPHVDCTQSQTGSAHFHRGWAGG